MTDGIAVIIAEHRDVEAAFREYHATPDADVVAWLCEEIILHADIEEAVLYPLTVSIDEALAEQAALDHERVRELVEDLGRADDDGTVRELIGQLEAAVTHHIRMEETRLLPVLSEQLTDDERRALCADLTDAKRQLRD